MVSRNSARNRVNQSNTATVKLPAHFILWAASREATFAKGRFLWCNWDVNELMKLSSKIADDPFFSISGVLSWRESEKDRKQ